MTRALFSVALALMAYRCEKGEYPDKLDVLVPKYLGKLPVDPVTGKALRYKKNVKGKGKGGFELTASPAKVVVVTPSLVTRTAMLPGV